MAWRDSYRTASFRGVEFKVESHDADFGRRQVTHEYPQRDTPYTEDLGRKARTFSVDAYLIGDDYNLQRDKLVQACEQPGIGELVHPYLGNMDVVCTGLKLRESTAEGRMCRVSMTFTEGGQAKYPSNGNDAVRAVTGSANVLKDAARGGFLTKFLTKGFPSFVIDAASNRVGDLSDKLSGLTVNPTADAQTVADFFTRVRALKNDSLSLVGEPADLADQITGVLSSIADVFGVRSEPVMRTVRSEFAKPYTGLTQTPNRQQQQSNYDAIGGLVRQVVTAEQARVAVLKVEDSSSLAGATDTTGGYTTRDEAIAARDELADAIDAEAENPATTTEVFQALTGLRAEVIRGIPSATQRLPRIAEVTPRATTSSLLLAYSLYEDASRGDEIADRNRARHPGFMPGDKPIEILTDG